MKGMARQRDNDYFQVFVDMVESSSKAAQLLLQTFCEFRAEELDTKIEEMHHIEHAADIQKHDMMNRLAKEFITPIEREDIVRLAQAIDDVTDSIEDVLLRVYMFHISSIHEEAYQFAQLVVRCCGELKKTMEEFRYFRKSRSIHDSIVEINRLEEEGDTLYTSALRSLYGGQKDAVEVYAWTQTYDRLEKCCDACEHAANVVESVIMVNT
jgi:predicted phosphate transport protein (TIGR00153 family)